VSNVWPAAIGGQRYPAVVRLCDTAWSEFIPFLDYDIEIHRVPSTTNAIESLNARYRRAVKARWHFPSEPGPPSSSPGAATGPVPLPPNGPAPTCTARWRPGSGSATTSSTGSSSRWSSRRYRRGEPP
jgi:Transposase, Mutator family